MFGKCPTRIVSPAVAVWAEVRSDNIPRNNNPRIFMIILLIAMRLFRAEKA
jgi:hypothetical protein